MSTHSPVPAISLIVNTYMKPRHLEFVLDSIEHQEGVDGQFEVVISDDGSTDETATLVARRAATVPFRLAFTSRPHDGFRLARVRNAGARIAHGERLLFLDGDCVLPRTHVAVHLARCREGVATGGDCARLDEQQSGSIDPTGLDEATVRALIPAAERRALNRRLRKWRWYSLIRHPTKPRLVGNNICIHRHDYERVNGFDERFVGWGQEDDDITLRLRAAGVGLATVLDETCSLHVWHPTDPTATSRWRDGANVAYFLRRGRLTRCRQGLVERPLHDLRWRLPADLLTTASGQGVAMLLGGAPLAAQRVSSPVPASGPAATRSEIDLVVRPGVGTFRKTRGRGECRVLIIEGDARAEKNVRSAADYTIRVPTPTSTTGELPTPELVNALENVG